MGTSPRAVLQARADRRKSVCVLFGSRSVEHEVAIVTALQAMDALDPTRYSVVPVLIRKSGEWVTGPELRRARAYRDMDALVARCSPAYLRPMPDSGRLYVDDGKRTRSVTIDCAIPIVHGTFGEDGTLQGLLELAGIPYAGPGVLAAGVGMDKVLMKFAFVGQGLPVTAFKWFHRDRWEGHRDTVLDDIQNTLKFPLFVKPANLGSSIGITRASTRDELADAIDVATHFDRRFLVEESVERAREINCSVLGVGDACDFSVCEEPIRWTDFLSYEDKYLQRGSRDGGGMQSAKRQIPADLAADTTRRIQALAVESFRAIDGAGVARVDFLLDEQDGRVYVNEINTIPGSLAFYLWKASGLGFSRLMDRLIAIAYARHQARARTTYTIDTSLLVEFGASGTKGKLGSKA